MDELFWISGACRHEWKIWAWELQLEEAYLHICAFIHRGHVTSYQISGGAQSAGHQPERLQHTNTVLHLCGRRLPLLPHLRLPAGDILSHCFICDRWLYMCVCSDAKLKFSFMTLLTCESLCFQELIFSVEGFKPFGWYLTLVQFGFYSLFGLVELQLTQDKRRR